MSSSALDYDVVLVMTDISGAFIDGLLQAWETGVASPPRIVSDDFRVYYKSTYTSWSGMVNVAATLAMA